MKEHQLKLLLISFHMLEANAEFCLCCFQKLYCVLSHCSVLSKPSALRAAVSLISVLQHRDALGSVLCNSNLVLCNSNFSFPLEVVCLGNNMIRRQ